MNKIVIRTDETAKFFARAAAVARRAESGQCFEPQMTLSFEDPERMFAVLSETRRKLLVQIMKEPKTIRELSISLARTPSAIRRDIGLLLEHGLVVSERLTRPGQRARTVVRTAAPKIELVATLG